MKVCFIGCSSNVIATFKDGFTSDSEIEFIDVCRNSKYNFEITSTDEVPYKIVPTDCDFYIISLGYLIPRRILQQNKHELYSSVNINMLAPVLVSEWLLENNQFARIVIIGSESGSKGSFDTTYFICKAAVQAYVRERRISRPGQSINMVSPSTIIDTKMTQRRSDLADLEKQLVKLPKKRAAKCKEVANVIRFLYDGGDSYISNQNICVNGGKFARMYY